MSLVAYVGIDHDGPLLNYACFADGAWEYRCLAQVVEEIHEANPVGIQIYETGARRFRVHGIDAVAHLSDRAEDDVAVRRVRNLTSLLDHPGLGDGRPVQVASSLAFDRVFLPDGGFDENFLRSQIDELEAAVVREPSPVAINVVRRDVALRGLAAYFDWSRDEAGKPRPGEPLQAPVTILDVGIHATTVVTCGAENNVIQGKSGVVGGGYLPLLKALEEQMRSLHGVPSIRLSTLLKCMDHGHYRMRGDTWKLEPLLKDAAGELAGNLLASAKLKSRSAGAVVVTGAAARPLADAMARAGVEVQVPEHPGFANSRGMAKYLREAE